MTHTRINKQTYASIAKWLPLGFAITVVFAFVYLALQQNLRTDANDPQVAIAGGIADALQSGIPYEAFTTPASIDIAQSLASYALLFDLDHLPVARNASLHGSMLTPPAGVFAYLKSHGEDRFTWQPEPGVRQAVVGLYHTGVNPGYIFVGRSLREVEYREVRLLGMTATAWAITMLGSLALSLLVA